MCPAVYLFIGFIVGFFVFDAIVATIILFSILRLVNDANEPNP